MDALSRHDDDTAPSLLIGKGTEFAVSSVIGETVQTRIPRSAMASSSSSAMLSVSSSSGTEMDGEKYDEVPRPDTQGTSNEEEEEETLPKQQQQQQQQQQQPHEGSSDAAGVLLTLGLGTSPRLG